jgi:hypothetical protein
MPIRTMVPVGPGTEGLGGVWCGLVRSARQWSRYDWIVRFVRPLLSFAMTLNWTVPE